MHFAKAIEREPKMVRVFGFLNTNQFESLTVYGKGIDKNATKSLNMGILVRNTENIRLGMHIANYLT